MRPMEQAKKSSNKPSAQHLHCTSEVYSKVLQWDKALKDTGLEVILLFPANNDHSSMGIGH